MSIANHTPGLRLCIPSPAGRGIGLGNELYSWAKAWLAARAIGGTALNPAFGLNPRQYWRYFGTSRLDFLTHRALLATLPRYRFTETDYLSTGEHDFRKAVAAFAQREGWHRRRLFALEVGGMWGGLLAIREARDFVLTRLYGTRGTAENLTDWRTCTDPDRLLVALHVRAGDFGAMAPGTDYRGRFNCTLPLDWYIAVCDSLRRHFGPRVQFQLFTDGRPEALAPFIERFAPLTGFHMRNSVCSDILAMAGADLLLCSISSFSLWGAFLSNAPYIWYAPHLQQHDGTCSIWGHEPWQQAADGPTALFRRQIAEGEGGAAPRGVPVGEAGEVPDSLLTRLEATLRQKRTATDLALYGVAPAHAGGAGAP